MHGEGPGSLPDTFQQVSGERDLPHLGEGGEEEKTRSSLQTEKQNLFGGRPQWMHLVYSGALNEHVPPAARPVRLPSH